MAPAARTSINQAIEAFDLLDNDIPMASDAARIMRDLISKAGMLMSQFSKALDIPAPSDIKRAADIPSLESAAWLRTPSPWSGETYDVFFFLADQFKSLSRTFSGPTQSSAA